MLQPKKKKPGSIVKRSLLNMIWMYLLIIAALIALYFSQDNSQPKEVTWSEFQTAALAGDIDKIAVITTDGTAEGTLTHQGARNQKFDMSNGLQVERKLIATIPSTDKFQDKIRNNRMFQEHMPNCSLRRVNIMSYNDKRDVYTAAKGHANGF